MGCEDAEVSLWVCGDEAIRELHRDYFGIDKATNVISFSQREGDYGDLDPQMLGDVVVSFETAGRDAAEAEQPLDDEVAFLFLHGVLHLLGFDHEGARAGEAPVMEAKERELMPLTRN